MAFSRRWLLILSALILGGGALFAATREERAYAAAATGAVGILSWPISPGSGLPLRWKF